MNFDERLMKAETSDELKKMKIWMFQEQVRIQAQKDEFIELAQELQKEKRAIERERDALNKRIKMEEKRFQNNEMLISKKQKIIEDAFRQLSVDKKVLECERLNFEYEKKILCNDNCSCNDIKLICRDGECFGRNKLLYQYGF